jgi:hypothetical protein
MLEQLRYRTKLTQSGIFVVRFWPMPSYGAIWQMKEFALNLKNAGF